jgi:RNA polymerase sigma-70 factor (ECF subfamily)
MGVASVTGIQSSSGVEAFEGQRRRLFGIAYRMLGTVSDAEDVVQEAYLRFRAASESGTDIASPRAFLTTVTTRLAMDHLKSARVRREEYVGEWLPEPILTGERDDAELSEQISLAFLVMLETLSPEERAAFVLREVFDYSYDEIAAAVDKSEQACRQLVSRAKKHLDARRPRFTPSREQRDLLAARFRDAIRQGDAAAIERFLTEDVVFYGDGGGKVPAAPRPVVGRERVTGFILGLLRIARQFGLSLEFAEVNGEPGAVARDGQGRLVSVLSLEIGDDGIHALRSIVNPDKLRHLCRLAGSEFFRYDR